MANIPAEKVDVNKLYTHTRRTAMSKTTFKRQSDSKIKRVPNKALKRRKEHNKAAFTPKASAVGWCDRRAGGGPNLLNKAIPLYDMKP